MGMAAIARRSGARVRRRRLAACAASAVMAAALAVPGGAAATPPTPVITATQSGALTARLTSSTGTHWSWTFLNAAAAVVGTSTLQNPLQAFPQAGDYTALVDATDDDPTATAPAHAQTTFHVYNTPTASFTYTVLAGGTVQFTDTSTGEPTSWQWTFPGGTFSGRTPPAQAIAPRTPPSAVTLTVGNPAGSNVVSVPIVVNGPPVAALTITPNPVGANTPVTLNASASTDPNGDALRYSWDLNGDKTYGDATGAIQTRTFTSPGTFRVGVRVSDPGGSSNDAVDFVTRAAGQAAGRQLLGEPGHAGRRHVGDLHGDGIGSGRDRRRDRLGHRRRRAIQRRHGRRRDTELRHTRLTDRVRARHGQRGRGHDRLPDDRGDRIDERILAGATGARRSGGWRTHELGLERQAAGDAHPIPDRALRGVIHRASARLSLLSIKAPQGAGVKVICHGGGCPKKRSVVLRVASGKSSVRVRSLERRLHSGAVIEVFVTARGRIGKYTRFTIRSNAAPARVDLCLKPGKAKPIACP